jgi:hypothetical protein
VYVDRVPLLRWRRAVLRLLGNKRWLWVVAALVVMACDQGKPAQPDLNRSGAAASPLTLRVGEAGEVHGVRLTFVGVAEDSRCATDVHCVWAGNARVELAARLAPGGGETRDLVLNTGLPPREAETHDLRVRLVRLEPEPLSTQAIPRDGYVVTLNVAGVDQEPGTPGLSVTTDTTAYAPGEAVKLTITNQSDETYWFNVCMDQLERRDGNDWVTVESDRVCIAIAQQLPAPGVAQAAYPLEADLPDGEYRVAVRLSNAIVVRSNAFSIAP